MNEPKGKTKTVKYVGEDTLTRGEYGERVENGHADENGDVWVWDSSVGWVFWSRRDSGDWK